MTVVEADVLIARPPQEVFDYLMEPNHLPIWDSSILEAEKLTPGAPRIGTRWRGASKILGRRFTWVTEIQEFDAPRWSLSRTVEGDIGFTASYALQDEDGGTRYTYWVDAEPGLSGVFGRITDPLVQSAQLRTMRGNPGQPRGAVGLAGGVRCCVAPRVPAISSAAGGTA